MKIWIETTDYTGWVIGQVIKGNTWIHFGGKTLMIEKDEPTKRRKSKAGRQDQEGNIDSPMPGKITKLLKAKGDKVFAGDIIVVMEAMKMEYTLKCEIDGIVTEVNVTLGEQVPLGKNLVQIGAS